MIRLWISLVLLASFAARAELQPDHPPELSIDEAVGMAVRDHPELARLRRQWEAMEERPAQARGLPNPMISVGGMDQVSGGSWPDTGQKRYRIQQMVPGLGKRGLREKVAGREVEIMRLEWLIASRDLAMRVKGKAHELMAVRRVLALLQEEEDILQRMEAVAETQYAAGERSQADVLMAQSEQTRLKQERLRVQAQENTLQAELNTLLNRRVNEALELENPQAVPDFGEEVEPLLAFAETNRPEIILVQTRVDRERLNQKRRSRESAPDYQVGVEYRDLDAGADMAMITLGVELPIWRAQERAGIQEASKREAASRAALENVMQLVALDVQDAHIQWMTAQETLDLIRTELISQARARFTASEAGYRTGKLDFLDLLASERFLLEARTKAASIEGEVGRQAARLERATGMKEIHSTIKEPVQ